MSSHELWKAPGVVPSLAYEDVPAAAEWLARAFGFRERSEARLSWPGGSMTWMELGDDILIHIEAAGGHERQSPKSLGAVSHALKVYVDNVDEHFMQAKEVGATIISEPEDKFWGGRVYEARDPEGHHWEFSERGRERAPDAWQLPKGVIRSQR